MYLTNTSFVRETGLGLSDFGVLEVLLNKGPLPVNTIGPIVDLTPGSISIAVDRLFSKGLVTRVEGTEDRRVRIVALTPRGKSGSLPEEPAQRPAIRRVVEKAQFPDLKCVAPSMSADPKDQCNDSGCYDSLSQPVAQGCKVHCLSRIPNGFWQEKRFS